MKRFVGFASAIFLAMLAGVAGILQAETVPKPEKLTVAIDVGHSINRPGAISARGRGEFFFNRDIARKLKAALEEQGYKAFLVNESGADISLSRRARVADKGGADLFLSIHHDAVNEKYYSTWEHEGVKRGYSDRFRGYSIFVSKKNTDVAESRRLGGLIALGFKDAGFTPTLHHNEPIKGENRPLLAPEIGLYEFSDLVVLKTNKRPAVLVECGVIVHRDEELEMLKPEVQDRIVATLVKAVDDFAAGKAVTDATGALVKGG